MLPRTMSAEQKSGHLAALRALRATRTAKRNAALIGPIVDALETLLRDPAEGPPVDPPPVDPPSAGAADPSVDSSDTESVGVPDEALPLLPAPAPRVGSFNVELAPPQPESRAAALAEREKETRKRLNKRSSRAEIERRCRRIMREPPKGAGRGSVDSDTVQALRSEDPKVFHVNLYV